MIRYTVSGWCAIDHISHLLISYCNNSYLFFLFPMRPPYVQIDGSPSFSRTDGIFNLPDSQMQFSPLRLRLRLPRRWWRSQMYSPSLSSLPSPIAPSSSPMMQWEEKRNQIIIIASSHANLPPRASHEALLLSKTKEKDFRW